MTAFTVAPPAVAYLLAALVLVPARAGGQTSLPVAGVDVPMPRLISTGVRYVGTIGEYPEFGRPDRGVWAVRFRITPQGRVRDVTLLTNHAGVPLEEFALIGDRVYESTPVTGQRASVVVFELIQRVMNEQELFDGLVKVAANEGLPEQARALAIEDLGAFPPAWRRRVVDVLAPLLGSPSAVLRQRAIDASEALNSRRGPVVANRDVPSPRRFLAGPPLYDPRDRAARRQGVIPMAITVGPNGRPVSVSLLHHIPELDESAIEAAYKWTYEPTVLNGRRQSVQVVQAVSFFLNPEGEWNWSSAAAMDPALSSPTRLAALERLQGLLASRTADVRRVLENLTTDSDLVVASDAAKRLARVTGN